MSDGRLSVVVTRRLPEAVEARMADLFDVDLRKDDTPMSRPDLIAAMQRADVLVPCITDKIDAAMLSQAGEKLKLIANYGAGVDHIDVSTARQRGILVSNTPGVMTDDTADMVMALILSVSRRLGEGERLVRSGHWEGWGPTTMLGHRIGGKRLWIYRDGIYGIDEHALFHVGSMCNAEFSTQPFDMPDDTLMLHASLSAYGNATWARQAYIMAELLDDAGRVVPGYEKEQCIIRRMHGPKQKLTWGDHFGEELAGQRVQLRFYLRYAHIYAVAAG